MLRRALPVVVAAAGVLTCLPTAAWATPEPAAVDNYNSGLHYTAMADTVPLADGRTASVFVEWTPARAGEPARGSIAVQSWREWDCGSQWGPCQADRTLGLADLTTDEFTIDRGLHGATVEVQVPLDDPFLDWDGGMDGGAVVDREPPVVLSVSATFTGTGTLATEQTHSTLCPPDDFACQSIRVYANRDASVDLSIDGVTGSSAAARLSADRAKDVAVRRSTPQY